MDLVPGMSMSSYSTGTTPLTNAQALYATLAGRISGVSTTRPLNFATKQYKPFGEYDLNEVQQSAGFFIQDRWRVTSSLTLSYGLRWEIIGDDHDVNGDYTSARSVGDLWGPTTLGVSLHAIQTGRIRQYVLFIVIGAFAIFFLISLFWSPTLAR